MFKPIFTSLEILTLSLLPYAGMAQQPSQQEKTASETVESKVSLKKPDETLYAIVARLDPQKAEDFNLERKSDEVKRILQQDLEIIRQYDVYSLPAINRAYISWSANELGAAYLRKKQPNIALDWFTYSNQFIDLETVKVHTGKNSPYITKLNVGIAAFNSRNYPLAIKYAKEYLTIVGDKGTPSTDAAKIIITEGTKRLQNP